MHKTKYLMIAITACFLCLLIGFCVGKNLRSKYIGVEEILALATEDAHPEKKGLININTADPDTLTLLPGIGDTYAQRIVDYRRKNGDFQSIEDITNVSGIGKNTFEELKDYITVD